MTSSCSRCGLPMDQLAGNCRFCGAQSSPAAHVQALADKPFKASSGSYRSRGKFEDLTLHFFDLGLLVVTLGGGGLIWAIFAAFAGQTPAGQLRDQVLVSTRNAIQAPAWKLIIRQLLTFAALTYLFLLVISSPGVLVDVGGYYFATYGLPGLLIGLMLADSLLLLTPLRRRLIDWVLAIRWTDGNGHSFRNYKSQGGF
jgi:hypothetical protein